MGSIEGFLTKVRNLGEKYLRSGSLPDTAVYWCGQAASLSQYLEDDVLRWAESLIAVRQFHRAAHILKESHLETSSWKGCYLAANAMFLANDIENASKVLESADHLFEKSVVDSSTNSTKKEWLVALLVLKGRVFEAMDNRTQATECFKDALKEDPFCHEAFHAITKHQMLKSDEEVDLLNSIELKNHDPNDKELIVFLYSLGLKKYDKPQDLNVPEVLKNNLKDNLFLEVAMAERSYYNCDYIKSHEMAKKVYKKDPYNEGCLPILISCLVELKKPNDLFLLAHRLVDLFPEWVISWFAVGSYYFLVGKQEHARRYLSRATQLDRVFGPSWLAYGHSFALENEHDQAIAAYFKAYQLMPGCHLPLLYIGVEYGLTNNVKLAEKFFEEASKIAPEDPFVLHELGVTCSQNGDYEEAEKYMLKALMQVQKVQQSSISSKWESLLNNLGHTARKLGKLEDALKYHQQALVLKPKSSSTYSAIGYTQTLMQKYFEAVESFHKALSLKRDDAFSTTMLNNVVEHLVDEIEPYENYPNDLPKLPKLSEIKDQTTSFHTTIDSTFEAENSIELNGSTDVEMSDV